MTASLSADDKDSVHYIYVCVKGEVAKVHSLENRDQWQHELLLCPSDFPEDS